jgi:hypothetical protein
MQQTACRVRGLVVLLGGVKKPAPREAGPAGDAAAARFCRGGVLRFPRRRG